MIRQARPFFDPAHEDLRFLPEGPRVLQNFPERRSILGWVAIQHGLDNPTGSMNLLDLATLENTRHDLPGRPGFFAETTQPGLIVIGIERRLILYDLLERKLTETGVVVSSDERTVINDGLAVREGLIFGSKDLKFNQEIATEWLFDSRSGELCTLKHRQICSNGKYVYQQGQQTFLADIDSPRKTVEVNAVDLDSRSLGVTSILADFRNQPAFPDGMRPTPDGLSLIIAFYNPGVAEFGIARQVSLDSGAVEAEWHLPGSPRVTCPEFIQIDGRVLVLFTTAVEGMSEDQRRTSPNAGMLFVGETDFAHLPPAPPLFPADAFADA